MEITSIDDTMDSYASFERAEEIEPRFYKAIYSKEEEAWAFTRPAVLRTELGESDWKVVQVKSKDKDKDRGRDNRNRDKGNRVDTNAEAKAKFEWGGKDGPKFSASLSGEVQKDDYYGRIEIERKKDGTGSVSGAAGIKGEHEEDD